MKGSGIENPLIDLLQLSYIADNYPTRTDSLLCKRNPISDLQSPSARVISSPSTTTAQNYTTSCLITSQ